MNKQEYEDEQRRKYLADLAKLKRIREQEKSGDTLFFTVGEEEANIDIIGEIPNKKTSPKKNVSTQTTDTKVRSSRTNALNTTNTSNTTSHAIRSTHGISKKMSSDAKSLGKGANKKKKHPLRTLFLFLVLFTIIGGGIYFAYQYFFSRQTGFYTVAVFGVDSRDGNLGKGALADVNMIANINMETGDIQLISIYRDLYSKIDTDGTYSKLNEAYSKGGPEMALATLESNLDLDLEDYATFNWKAVVDAINILGGIDLEITEAEFAYINSFITETVESTGVGSHHLESAGMNHLDGVQAVAYARLRLMDTDFNRTERQRKVVSLAFEKAKQADFATLNQLVMTILPQTSTNISLDDVIPLLRQISDFNITDTAGFPFDKETKKISKRDYVIPVTLRTNVIALHTLLYGSEDGYTYAPSSMVNSISKHIIEVTGIGVDKEESSYQTDPDLNNTSENTSTATSTIETADTQNSQTNATTKTESTTSIETSTEATVETTETNAETVSETTPKTTETIDSTMQSTTTGASIEGTNEDKANAIVPSTENQNIGPAGDMR